MLVASYTDYICPSSSSPLLRRSHNFLLLIRAAFSRLRDCRVNHSGRSQGKNGGRADGGVERCSVSHRYQGANRIPDSCTGHRTVAAYNDYFESMLQLAPMDLTACCAIRSSVAQSPPAMPMPPMHSPSAITGQPPSIAVHRSGPAASARPSAWTTSSCCAWAPREEVGRLFEAAHTALVVAECTE